MTMPQPRLSIGHRDAQARAGSGSGACTRGPARRRRGGLPVEADSCGGSAVPTNTTADSGEQPGDHDERRGAADDLDEQPGERRPDRASRRRSRSSRARSRAPRGAAGRGSGTGVRSPTELSGAVRPATPVTRTSVRGVSVPAVASAAIRTRHAAPTSWSMMISRVRPCRSRRAPTIGLMTSPGATLANVTTPARTGEPNRSSVNSTMRDAEHAAADAADRHPEQDPAERRDLEERAVRGRRLGAVHRT